MRKLLIQLTAIVLVLSACQKELSLEDPNAKPGTPPSNNTGTRLVRTGTRLGTDTITIDYSYNTANHLTGLSFSGIFQGQAFTLQQKINRNAAHVITSVVVRSPFLLLLNYGRDSLVTNFVYDATTSRYVRSTTQFVYDNRSLTDSTVYSYSNAGKLNSSMVYITDGTFGYVTFRKTDFTYAENNLVEARLYESDGINFTLEEVTTLKHDARVNPLPLPAEAPFLLFEKVYSLPMSLWFYMGLNDFFSVNNISNIKTEMFSTPSLEEAAVTYTYNSSNLPVTCVRTIRGAPFSMTTYYYQ